MNVNKGQLTYVHTVPDFNKMMADPTKKIKDVFLPTPEVAAIQWESAKEFVPQDASTNIFLATFTTAWARLKLYSEMEKLGRDVLYHDTDSIIYATNGRNDPPLGGPKNYAYQTATGKTCCKVRGFSLNFRNSQLLNFEAIKSLVCSLDQKDVIALHNPSKITREPKRRKVVNKPETKMYKVVLDKRVIQADFTTLPFGF
ncbi:uncharacterized protein LOC118192782 isoform X2 [Stegodyphus dumicola]|uniref:uncharacterized protein LOC118192782 isoform X2 n=1 Tax=Stegodyphus dumicola TaxID=202533 RepID=UPI0015AD606D|nr:uncharacterized protein LOC118192782 isoform X2 [Stegodyphus dumicola]